MKKVRLLCLWITILFCIDYSITQLLGFSFFYNWIIDQKILHYVYAFVIGVCGFMDMLSLKKEE